MRRPAVKRQSHENLEDFAKHKTAKREHKKRRAEREREDAEDARMRRRRRRRGARRRAHPRFSRTGAAGGRVDLAAAAAERAASLGLEAIPRGRQEGGASCESSCQCLKEKKLREPNKAVRKWEDRREGCAEHQPGRAGDSVEAFLSAAAGEGEEDGGVVRGARKG